MDSIITVASSFSDVYFSCTAHTIMDHSPGSFFNSIMLTANSLFFLHYFQKSQVRQRDTCLLHWNSPTQRERKRQLRKKGRKKKTWWKSHNATRREWKIYPFERQPGSRSLHLIHGNCWTVMRSWRGKEMNASNAVRRKCKWRMWCGRADSRYGDSVRSKGN